jgi:hypothetical protein
MLLTSGIQQFRLAEYPPKSEALAIRNILNESLLEASAASLLAPAAHDHTVHKLSNIQLKI